MKLHQSKLDRATTILRNAGISSWGIYTNEDSKLTLYLEEFIDQVLEPGYIFKLPLKYNAVKESLAYYTDLRNYLKETLVMSFYRGRQAVDDVATQDEKQALSEFHAAIKTLKGYPFVVMVDKIQELASKVQNRV